MKIVVLTIYPDMVMHALTNSVIGDAIKSGVIDVEAVHIRDYAENKHYSVMDYPFGGGAGMVMQVGPIVRAIRSVKASMSGEVKVIYTSPQGKVFSQAMAEEFSQLENIIILCGHFEGVDERALELEVDEEVSIGDYVLTGGELAAMVMVDSICRLIPGVLHNDDSSSFESHQNSLLEYPQYSRPREFEGLEVPEVLLSGNHANIEAWRREQSLLRTKQKRPDLLENAVLTDKDKKFLANNQTE